MHFSGSSRIVLQPTLQEQSKTAKEDKEMKQQMKNITEGEAESPAS